MDLVSPPAKHGQGGRLRRWMEDTGHTQWKQWKQRNGSKGKGGKKRSMMLVLVNCLWSEFLGTRDTRWANQEEGGRGARRQAGRAAPLLRIRCDPSQFPLRVTLGPLSVDSLDRILLCLQLPLPMQMDSRQAT